MTADRAIFDDLIGQYKVEQHCTEKRYTDLHVAYDVDEDRPVTLDVLRLPYAADSAFASEFVARAKAISQIRHPNVVQVYDTGRTPDGRPFVVQARVDGTTLMYRIEQLAQRETPANSVYVLKLMRQLAEAVLLAERFGLSHYDLNPGNVWLRNVARPTDESVLLLDLSIPCVAQAGWPANGGRDRSIYLSPEQMAGKTIDSRSHIYSMGVMLFCLLAGQEPTRAVGRRDAAARRVTSGPTMLGRIRGGLAQETYELVERAMRAEANLRYERVGEFIGALDQAIAAEEAGVRAVAQPKPSVINRALGFVIPALAAAVLLVTSLAWVGNRDGGLPVADAAPFGTAEATGQAAAASVLVSEVVPTNTPVAVLLPAPETDGAVATGKLVPTDEPSPTATTEPTGMNATDTRAAAAIVVIDPTATPEPSATPTVTSSPTPAAPQVRIIVNAANLRRGPGKAFDDIGTLAAGEIVEVIAHSDQLQDNWYLVRTSDGRLGWLWPGLAEAVAPFEPSQLPAAATIPATPTPLLTPTALPVTPTSPVTDAPPSVTNVPPAPQPTSPHAPPTRTPPPLTDGG